VEQDQERIPEKQVPNHNPGKASSQSDLPISIIIRSHEADSNVTPGVLQLYQTPRKFGLSELNHKIPSL
jgi:hypothetical protein